MMIFASLSFPRMAPETSSLAAAMLPSPPSSGKKLKGVEVLTLAVVGLTTD